MRCRVFIFFFFNDTATTEIYTLSLHDALPILVSHAYRSKLGPGILLSADGYPVPNEILSAATPSLRFLTLLACYGRSEEHTSELQSQSNLVCRLLLEKKK